MDDSLSLIEDIHRLVMPRRSFENILAAAGIGPPELPYNIADCDERAFANYLRFVAPRGSLRDAVALLDPIVAKDERPTKERIDIRSIYGVTDSSSKPRTLAGIGAEIDFARLFQRYQTIDDVARAVIGAGDDCVSLRGHPIRILRQAWDGRMYVDQRGGSHRFSALWRWHNERGTPRMLDCEVYRVVLMPRAHDAALRYRYWFCGSTRNLYPLERGAFETLSGIQVQQAHMASHTWLLACPRGHRLEGTFEAAMVANGAADISRLILGTLSGG